ncbi:group II truncated hemoglobin [Niveibacterium sp. SC-1]|uniref:group II truncated hemoglobin n=1 Tax=Niveibacterium sp. SC-1 TaxID=3135646 RepID=UPI00311F1B5D
MQEQSFYDIFGGEPAVRTLVDRFYDLMDLEPHAAQIRALHPESLEGSREKLFEFLSGWLGGPSLYIAKRGHPRMRARHLPFAIGESERDAWLRCMDQAVAETLPAGPAREAFLKALHDFADHMRNQD